MRVPFLAAGQRRALSRNNRRRGAQLLGAVERSSRVIPATESHQSPRAPKLGGPEAGPSRHHLVVRRERLTGVAACDRH
jgi:hypothetical protein